MLIKAHLKQELILFLLRHSGLLFNGTFEALVFLCLVIRALSEFCSVRFLTFEEYRVRALADSI